MITKELYAFIQKQQKDGKHPEEITQLLRDNGWTKEDIRLGFEAVENGTPIKESTRINKPSLLTTEELLKQTFSTIKLKIKPVIGIVIMVEAVLLVLQLISQNQAITNILNPSSSSLFSEILGILGTLIIIVMSLGLQTIAAISVINSIEQDRQLKDSLTFSLDHFRKGWLIVVLTLFSVVGGIVLLIVPGVMMGIWLLFGLFIMVDQKATVLDSLQKSRDLAKGYWWPLVWRLAVLSLLLGLINIGFDLVINAIVQLLGVTNDLLLNPIIGFLSSVVTYPVSIIYMLLLYKDIKEKNPADEHESSSFRWLVVSTAIIGLVSFVYSLVST